MMPEIDPAILTLANDERPAAPSLDDYLAEWAGTEIDRLALARLITTIAGAAAPLARRLALGRLPGDPAAIVGTNESGDRQKALDVAAHHHFIATLGECSVHSVLSEEAEAVIELDRQGRYAVAMDPIDGSGSIGIGAPLGTLFCVFPATGGFLRSGRDICAAGYIAFGHSTDFGFSLGAGAIGATFDPRENVFRVDPSARAIPPESSMLAFNASNRRHWPPELARYMDDCMAGLNGPFRRDFNMRWLAAAVGDLHRILRNGGVFLYPGETRSGRENGFLRLIYEAFPIAWLVEQAGGAASDGQQAILDRVPGHLHQRTPLIFGSRQEVDRIQRYLENSGFKGEA